MYKKFSLLLAAICSLNLWLALDSTAASKPFEEAVKDYLAGRNEQATAKLLLFTASNPKDEKGRYYLALSYMQENRLPEAATQFHWLAGHSQDKTMKSIAEEGLQRVQRIQNGQAGKRPQAKVAVSKNHEPVRKVICFYTNWSGACKKFSSTFNMARAKYSWRVNFEKLNAEDPRNWNAVEKYNVVAYPDLVYLDAHDNVIENSVGAPLGAPYLDYLRELGIDK